jgi:hypothetical protein
MSPRGTGRTSPCNQHQAHVRFGHAVKYREVAEMVAIGATKTQPPQASRQDWPCWRESQLQTRRAAPR